MSHPDASIVQGYLSHECISFYESYLGVENPIVGLPVKKHLGRLEGVGHITRSRELHVDYSGRRTNFDRANLVVSQHLQMIDPFLALHKDIIEKYHLDKGITKTDAELTIKHNSYFLCWFKEDVLANPPQQGCTDDENLIYALAHGPAVNLATYQAY